MYLRQVEESPPEDAVAFDPGSPPAKTGESPPGVYRHLRRSEHSFPDELVAAYEPHSASFVNLHAVCRRLMTKWLLPGRSRLAVVAADAGHGTSFVAANLSVLFSQSGLRTLLVDANIYRPRQATIFLKPRSAPMPVSRQAEGCTAGLEKIAAFDSLFLMQNQSAPAAGMTAGIANPSAVAGLGLSSAIHDTPGGFDVTVIDCPPFSDGGTALALSAQASGVLLVMRKGHTRFNDVRSIEQAVRLAGGEIIGAVLLEF